MRRVGELEQWARVARQQALLTTNRETSEALLEIARRYAMAADERRAALKAANRGLIPLRERPERRGQQQVERTADHST